MSQKATDFIELYHTWLALLASNDGDLDNVQETLDNLWVTMTSDEHATVEQVISATVGRKFWEALDELESN